MQQLTQKQDQPSQSTQNEPAGTAFPKAKRKEWLLLALLFLWGYLFVSNPPMVSLGISVTLFELSAVGLMALYLHVCGQQPLKTSWPYLGMLGLSALSFSFFENSGFQGPLFLLQFPLFAGWLLHASQERPLTAWDLWDSFTLLAAKPFSHLAQKWNALAVQSREKKKTQSILLGVLITLPVLAVATALLMGADERFADIVSRLGGQLGDNLGELLLRVIPAAIIGLYLFSMALSAAFGKRAERQGVKMTISPITMGILLAALCLLYVAFLGLQAETLSQAWAEQSGSAAMYSQMARGGFFELCAVCLLNLGVFLCVHYLVREEMPLRRVALTVLAALTLLIIVTAMLKMAAYMDLYGFTLLRVQTSWFMASLFLAFCVLIAAQWTRLKPFRWIAAFCAVSVLIASYANIGGRVAQGNVDRYLAGTLAAFDVDEYRSFPYEAAPHLIRLERETVDPEVKLSTQRFLATMADWQNGGWATRTVQAMLAEQQVEEAVAGKNWPKESR